MTLTPEPPESATGQPIFGTEQGEAVDANWSWLEFWLASIEQMIITFGLYCLSIGPMYWTWLRAHHADHITFVGFLYRPLYVFSEWFPPLAEWLNWYVRFWIL